MRSIDYYLRFPRSSACSFDAWHRPRERSRANSRNESHAPEARGAVLAPPVPIQITRCPLTGQSGGVAARAPEIVWVPAAAAGAGTSGRRSGL